MRLLNDTLKNNHAASIITQKIFMGLSFNQVVLHVFHCVISMISAGRGVENEGF